MAQITCVLSGVLGNRIFSARLADAVDRVSGESGKLWFDTAVYRNHPAPRWIRRLSVYESEWVARDWLREHSIQGAVVVNGYTLAMAGRWQRMVVATDMTPSAAFAGRLRQRMIMASVSARFRRLARRVSAWLPWSETVARSLIEDYGVAPERCFVTRAPQPVIDPCPHTPTGSILFVGNDFERKGGPELLGAFERNLLADCRLVIVSNDASLRNRSLPKNVRVVPGIHDPLQLAEIYRQSDLLVLPTRFDVYSIVVCEAAAHGIPSLATRVGGVGELLDESGGISLPSPCQPGDVAAGIREALGDGYVMRARAAGEFAKQKLSLPVFDATVRRALDQL
jgi:glycosyltransferase involved in cell wall biosynthesis